MVYPGGNEGIVKKYPVITVSGCPGSGKTTLSKRLADEFGWTRISFDDYEGMTSRAPEELAEWRKAGMPFDQLFVSDCAVDVINASERSGVVFETPLGRLHQQEGIAVAHSIWIACNLDVALSRVLLKEVSAQDWQDIQELQNWVKGYLEAYNDFVFEAIIRQRDLVHPLADTVLDGHRLPEEVFKTARSILSKRFL